MVDGDKANKEKLRLAKEHAAKKAKEEAKIKERYDDHYDYVDTVEL